MNIQNCKKFFFLKKLFKLLDNDKFIIKKIIEYNKEKITGVSNANLNIIFS